MYELSMLISACSRCRKGRRVKGWRVHTPVSRNTPRRVSSVRSTNRICTIRSEKHNIHSRERDTRGMGHV
jgi:hypothetical protein